MRLLDFICKEYIMITNKQLEDWKSTIIERGFPAWEEKVYEWLRKDRVIKAAQGKVRDWLEGMEKHEISNLIKKLKKETDE